MEMKYQFQINGNPGGPTRETWGEAAMDAVKAGYAEWRDERAVQFNASLGGSIARLGLVEGIDEYIQDCGQ